MSPDGPIPYLTVDVFTDTRFAGNPLAVVPDASRLDPALFQLLAREFAYSETSFVLPPADPANDAHVRIFTPAEELPFAGHPNVGTAFVLARLGTLFGRPVGDRLRFEEGAGLVEIDILREGAVAVGATVRAPAALVIGETRTPEDVAALAGLTATDILTTTHRPCYAGTGNGFLVAETRVAALARAVPQHAAFLAERQRMASEPGPPRLPALLLWAREGEGDPLAAEMRVFVPLSGIPEDPATGSAATALGALLERLGVARRLVIRQGLRIGRPSLLEVETGAAGTFVSGRCVAVLEGRIM
jgi:trans-2,3-dihydro-3-hydroxyanthranilate isomerase